MESIYIYIYISIYIEREREFRRGGVSRQRERERERERGHVAAREMKTENGLRKQGGGGAAPCAACKLLRRRCGEECVFAPYFPADQPHKFANVHKVFGASNVNKMLQVP